MQELLHSLLIGFSLLLIAEGVLPFMSPRVWREFMAKAITSSDKNLRVLGALSMFLGLTLLLLARS